MGDNHCFVCGPDNPFGLHIHFTKTEGGAEAEFLCEARHCGWPGIQHGGITAAILDEACAYVPYFQGLVTLTADLQLHYDDPVHKGELLHIRARPTRVTRRLLEVEAVITGAEEQVKARAQAKMMVLNDRQKQQAGLTDTAL